MDEPADMPLAADEPRPFRFRMVHVGYLVTLLASALGTFDAAGLLPFFAVAVFWAIVFSSRSRPQALETALVVIVLLGCPLLFFPAVQSPREAGPRMQCAIIQRGAM